MDSNLLKIFVEVAKENSISKAAINLNFAQSNITSRIKQLEKSIGIILFYRVPKGVILTKEGKKLYPYALEIVKKIELANSEIKNMNEQIHLIIGSTESNASVRIIPFLTQLHEDYPNISLELIIGTTHEIMRQLLEYKIDIAFISGNPKIEEFIILNKIDETMALIEPKNKKSPNVFLSFKKGCAYNDFGHNYLKELFKEDFKNLEFGNYETILGCVKIGMGKSILPLSIIKKLNYEKELNITKLAKNKVDLSTYMVCKEDNLPKIKKYLEDYTF